MWEKEKQTPPPSHIQCLIMCINTRADNCILSNEWIKCWNVKSLSPVFFSKEANFNISILIKQYYYPPPPKKINKSLIFLLHHTETANKYLLQMGTVNDLETVVLTINIFRQLYCILKHTDKDSMLEPRLSSVYCLSRTQIDGTNVHISYTSM